MQYGWSSPMIPILRSNSTPFNVTQQDEFLLEQLYLIGGVTCLPLTILLINMVGRKGSLVCATCVSLLCWILIALPERIECIFIARFLAGFAGDVNFVAAPMYIAEVAQKHIRGVLSCILLIMLHIGLLIIYISAPLIPIYASCLIGIVISVLQLGILICIPESPYYLLIKGKTAQAERNLRILRSSPVKQEIEEMLTAVEKNNVVKGKVLDLFLVKSNRKALLIVIMLHAAQNFSGISVMIMNIHLILGASKLTYLNPMSIGIIFASIMLFTSCMSGFFIDKFGRRTLLIISSLLAGTSVACLAVYLTLQNYGEVFDISWIPITAVMIYALAFRLGLGIVPAVMSAELFPLNVKALGMSLVDVVYMIFALLSIQIYKILSENVGMDVPFYIYASCSFLSAVIAFIWLPETKGLSLEEIQFMLRGETSSSDVVSKS